MNITQKIKLNEGKIAILDEKIKDLENQVITRKTKIERQQQINRIQIAKIAQIENILHKNKRTDEK